MHKQPEDESVVAHESTPAGHIEAWAALILWFQFVQVCVCVCAFLCASLCLFIHTYIHTYVMRDYIYHSLYIHIIILNPAQQTLGTVGLDILYIYTHICMYTMQFHCRCLCLRRPHNPPASNREHMHA